LPRPLTADVNTDQRLQAELFYVYIKPGTYLEQFSAKSTTNL